MRRMRTSWTGTAHIIAVRILGKQQLPPAKFSTREVFKKGSTFIQQEATTMARRCRRELVCWV